MSFRGLQIALVAPVWNEEVRLSAWLPLVPTTLVDHVIVVDDASSDRSASLAKEAGFSVISHAERCGVGAAIRTGMTVALQQGADVVVVIAGNGKDDPREIERLLAPIADGRADFVQGSRYLSQKPRLGDFPLYRLVATRLHPLLFTAVSGRRVSESTNGFRAVHRRVLTDARMHLQQPWLNRYELEPYLYLRAIKLGYRTEEVAVSKVHPPTQVGSAKITQTKMRPVIDWWSILRPLLFARLGIYQ